MKLIDFLATIESSSPQEWQCIGELRVLKNDVRISFLRDEDVVSDFKEPWANKFPDSYAVSISVKYRFNGAVVYEDIFVTVDGGRCILPMPDAGSNTVDAAKATRARLVDATSGHTSQFDSYFQRAGLVST